MAIQNKALDPAAAALSAIEEALKLANVSGDYESSSPASHEDNGDPQPILAPPAQPRPRTTALRLPEIDDASHMLGPQESASQFVPSPPPARPTRATRGSDGPAAPTGLPANDDRHNVGRLLQALNAKPSRAPYWLAVLASLAWLGTFGAYLYSTWTLPAPLNLKTLAAQPEIGLGALMALGPVFLFFVIAALARRVQEIRLSARSMTAVAFRLAEPETLATEQVVSLSQAIRREVAAMGDGIERALARAGEFETLVRAEVSNLERSYGENERRMRALVEGLSSEREAILSNAERVRAAIGTVHENIAGELHTVGIELAERVSDAGERVTGSLGAKGEEITSALSRTGDEMVGKLQERGADMIDRLAGTGGEVTSKLISASQEIARSLAESVTEIDDRLKSTTDALATELSGRADSVAERLDEAGSRIAETISVHGDNLATRLGEASQRMHELVSDHGRTLDENLASHTDALHGRLATTVKETHEALARHAEDVTVGVSAATSEAVGLLVQHSSTFRDHLTETSQATVKTFETRTGDLSARFTATALGAASALAQHANALQDRFAETAEATVASMTERTGAIEERFASVADATTAALERHETALHARFGTHAESTLRLLADRAGDLHDRFAATATEVIGAIGMHGDRVNEMLGQQQSRFGTEAEAALLALTERTSDLHERLAATAADAINAIGLHGDRVNETLGQQQDRFGAETDAALRALTERTSDLHERFAATATETINAIGQHGDRVSETLGQQHGRFGDEAEAALRALTERTSDLHDRFAATAAETISAIGQHGDRVSETLGQQQGRFGAEAEAALRALSERTSDLHERFAATATDAINAIGVHGDRVSETLGRQQGRFGAEAEATLRALTERTSDLHERFAAAAAETINAIGLHGDRVSETLGQQQGRFGAEAEATLRALAERTSDLHERFAATAAETIDAIGQHGDRVSETLGQQQGRFGTEAEAALRALTERTSELHQRFVATATEAADAIGQHGDRVNETLGQHQARFATEAEAALQALTERTSDLHERFAATATDGIGAISLHGDRVGETLGYHLSAFEGLIKNEASEVAARLATQSEQLQQTLAASTAELHDRFAATATDAISAISVHGDRANETLGNQLAAFEGLLKNDAQDMVGRIASQSARLTQTLNEKVGAVEHLFASHGGVLAERLGQSATEAAEVLAARLEVFEESSAAKAQQVANTLDGLIGRVDATLDKRAKGLSDALGNRAIEVARVLGEGGREVTRAMETKAAEIESILLTRSNALTESLSGKAREISATFGARTVDLAKSFDHHIAAFEDRVSGRFETMSDALLGQFAKSLEERGKSLVDDLSVRTSEIDAILNTHAKTIQTQTDSIDATLAVRVKEIRTNLVNSAQEANAAFTGRLVEVIDTLAARGRELHDVLGGRAGELQAIFDTKGPLLVELLSARGGEIAEEMANVGEAVTRMIESRGAAITEHLARTRLELAAAIDRSREELRETIETSAARSVDSLVSTHARLRGEVERSASGLREKIEASTVKSVDSLVSTHARLHGEVERSTSGLADKIETTTLQSVDALVSTHARLRDEVEKSASGLTERIEAGTVQSVGALVKTHARLQEAVERTTSGLAETIEASTAQSVEALIDTHARLQNEVERATSGLADKIETTTVQSVDALVSTHARLHDEVERATADLADKIEARTVQSVDALVSTHARLQDEVERTASGLEEKIEASTGRSVDALVNTHARLQDEVEKTTSGLEEKLEASTGRSVEALVRHHARLHEEVERSASGLSKKIETSAVQSVGTLVNTHARLHGEVERSHSALRENIEASAAQSVDSLSGVGEVLSSLVGKLGEANAALQDILTNSGGNLTGLERAMAERLREFQGSLGTISSQVISLQRTSAATMTDAGALVEKLSQNGEELAAATLHLQRTHSDVSEALEARRDALERLLNDVGGRAEEFDKVMRGFTKTVEVAFENAEVRAREIGTFLTSASQAATGEISDQFEIIRANTGREQERTAEALRSAYEQASSEMSELLSRATDQFRGSVDQMRDMTSQIRLELDATQQELRRGALEVPKETAEQAAAMRRVVAEQIKALNELTDIVTRSGRAFDVVESTSPPPRRQPEPARQTEFREPVRPAEPAAPRLLDASAPRREQPRAPVESRPAPPRREEPARPRAAPPRPAPAAPQQSPPGERRQGWLSDLLARASREDAGAEPQRRPVAQPTRSATQTIESLDSISLDIARMIDHDASVELWERYRRGERNVFTRSLYTRHGQQNFDEIRRRYRADDEFRATVDRYTQEFERLLDEVSREDRDGLLAKTYLTSETGKVYTMLAHASGRLE